MNFKFLDNSLLQKVYKDTNNFIRAYHYNFDEGDIIIFTPPSSILNSEVEIEEYSQLLSDISLKKIVFHNTDVSIRIVKREFNDVLKSVNNVVVKHKTYIEFGNLVPFVVLTDNIYDMNIYPETNPITIVSKSSQLAFFRKQKHIVAYLQFFALWLKSTYNTVEYEIRKRDHVYNFDRRVPNESFVNSKKLIITEEELIPRINQFVEVTSIHTPITEFKNKKNVDFYSHINEFDRNQPGETLFAGMSSLTSWIGKKSTSSTNTVFTSVGDIKTKTSPFFFSIEKKLFIGTNSFSESDALLRCRNWIKNGVNTDIDNGDSVTNTSNTCVSTIEEEDIGFVDNTVIVKLKNGNYLSLLELEKTSLKNLS